MPAQVKFREVLTDLIQKKGFSRNRKKLCDALGISAASLSQYERGATRPSFDVLVELASALDVGLDYLVFGLEHRVAEPPDYGPYVRYMDMRLAGVQARISQESAVTMRIAQALSERIAIVAKELGERSQLVGGLINDEETMVVERCSGRTLIASMNLQYDVISPDGDGDGQDAAGRFLPIVAENLLKDRQYQFLLPKRMRDWAPVVTTFRELLVDRLGRRDPLKNCEFRLTTAPLVSGFGLYELDMQEFSRESPVLFEGLRRVVSADGWLGYVIPASEDLQADCLMDQPHLDNARKVFREIWKHGEKL